MVIRRAVAYWLWRTGPAVVFGPLSFIARVEWKLRWAVIDGLAWSAGARGLLASTDWLIGR
jgi:hypothetical protein